MKKWYVEDWEFTIEVLQVGDRNAAEECRLGLEPGDKFICQYGTPDVFCPAAFFKLFPLLEVVRCEGDLRNLGSESSTGAQFLCPDGVVLFGLKGERLHWSEAAQE